MKLRRAARDELRRALVAAFRLGVEAAERDVIAEALELALASPAVTGRGRFARPGVFERERELVLELAAAHLRRLAECRLDRWLARELERRENRRDDAADDLTRG